MTLLENGTLTTAFRKWMRPSVSESCTLLTPVVGQLKLPPYIK